MGKHLLYQTISNHFKPFLYISNNLAKFPLFIGTAAILRRCPNLHLVIPSDFEQNRRNISVYRCFEHFVVGYGEINYFIFVLLPSSAAPMANG